MLFGLACIAMMATLSKSTAERWASNKTCDICYCSDNYVVNCSNRNLEYIPRDIDPRTRVLDLSTNYLQHIEGGSFENLTQLISLNLYNTALKKGDVSPNAFNGLVNLRYLNISHNDQFPLTNMSTPEELFQHVPSLEVLRMYGTTGTYNIKDGYPDDQLSSMVNLSELWIDGFTKSSFGPAFRNMTNLKILRVAGDSIEPAWRSNEFCAIEELEDGMLDNLVTVTHLYMRKCSIKSIGKHVFRDMENLKYLDMSMNRRLGFDQLFQSFCSLPFNTTSLIINEVARRSSHTCGNFITKKMAQCIKDKAIRELQLNQNVIYYIEHEVFSTFPKSLEIVSARKNEFHLGFYMFYVFTMPNLKRLDISYQFFTEATSIWHNKNDNSEVENTRCKTSYLNKNMQSNDKHEESSNDYNDQGSLDQYIIVPSTDEQISEINDILQGKDHQGAMSMSISENNQRKKLQFRTGQISSQNRDKNEKVCPQLSKDNYIPPGTILINIPPELEYLDLSHSKHANPIFEMFVNETNNLQIINASNSLIYCWDGPVHGLTKIKEVDLSNNFCTNVSKRFFEKLTSLIRLNISYNFLGTVIAKDVNGRLMANLTKLESIDFSFNLIQNVPESFLKSQKELIHLIGHVNMMEEFDVDIRHMTKLRRLDLKANKLRTLSTRMREDLEMISTSGDRYKNGDSDINLSVDLRANPLECSCENIGFIKWLYIHYDSNSSLFVNVSHCLNYENHRKRVNINSQNDIKEMVQYLESHCRSFTALIVGLSVTLAVIINVILGFIVHRLRWKLQYWYYVVFNRETEGRNGYELIEEPEYKYDVFVASPDNEKEFVIDKLRPVFRRNGIMAFLAVYHINFNDRLVYTIGKAINESKVVLFVFSNEWSTDHCMNIAVHMWQCDMIQRRRRPVLGVYLNKMTGADASKVKEIYCRTFIDFPGETDEEEQEAFWIDCVKNIREQGELQ